MEKTVLMEMMSLFKKALEIVKNAQPVLWMNMLSPEFRIIQEFPSHVAEPLLSVSADKSHTTIAMRLA
jgi:hypothetical protein